MSSAIVEAARATIGTPFRWQGREPGTGLDCVGLVCAAAAAEGVEIARDDRYAPGSDYSAMLRRYLEQSFDPTPTPFAGAIVSFWVVSVGYPRHLGVLTPSPFCSTWNIVHTTERTGRVVEHELEGGLASRVDSFWRLRI